MLLAYCPADIFHVFYFFTIILYLQILYIFNLYTYTAYLFNLTLIFKCLKKTIKWVVAFASYSNRN